MRWQYVFILASLIAVPACSAPELPTIPAPWDPMEPQTADPTQPSEAGLPTWERIGNSTRGKPIEAVTLGTGPRRVYIIGGLHGDEPEGPAAAGKLPAVMLNDLTGDSAAGLTLRILRDANPDGTALGQRGNTRGTDLNRNFPARNYNPESLPGRRQGSRPASELEVDAVLKDLRAFKPDVVLVLRTAQAGRGPQVAFEGPTVSMGYGFASAARAIDPRWRLLTEKTFMSPGSPDSLVAHDMRKTAFSVEFRRGVDALTNAKSLRAGLLAIAPKPAAKAPAPTAPVHEPVLGGRS